MKEKKIICCNKYDDGSYVILKVFKNREDYINYKSSIEAKPISDNFEDAGCFYPITALIVYSNPKRPALSKCIGEILCYTDVLELYVLLHECIHAAFHYCRITNNPKAKFGKTTDNREEKLCNSAHYMTMQAVEFCAKEKLFY